MGKKRLVPLLPEGEKNVSMREMVYGYLCESMSTGSLRYGEYLDQGAICVKLGISRAPLRDALIRLEAEGFVTIQPNRGIFVNPLTQDYIRSAYVIMGAVESACLEQVFHLLTPEHTARFEASNALQREYLEAGKNVEYYLENIVFHQIFLSLSQNTLVDEVLQPIRRRLYGFPFRTYSMEWEQVSLEEHERFIASLKKGNKTAAVSVFRDEHWSFDIHQQYFSTYYQPVEKRTVEHA